MEDRMLVQTVRPASLLFRDDTEARPAIRVSEIISALSYALDLTEGRPMGHAVRSCIIGMRIGAELGLGSSEQSDLYYALLLKDAGCSSNSSKLFHLLNADEIRAKRDVKLTDWTRVGWESLQFALTHVATGAAFPGRIRALLRVAARRQTDSRAIVKIRCERGASIARTIGFPEPVARAIHSLDEHWDGGGHPDGLRREEIPLCSRIMNLAQTLEVFLVHGGSAAAIDIARKRSGKWFDPELVRAAVALGALLWDGLQRKDAMAQVLTLEPAAYRIPATEETIERICQAFAGIVDAKSPFTYRHSVGVAEAATGISRQLGLCEEDVTFMRRAALLHDVGKLSVSNEILEKPAALDQGEWDIVKRHPHYTLEILRRLPGFGNLSDIAAAHHEKLDGTGYFRGWDADQLSLEMRILTVADIYDALAAKRPYRDAMPVEKVFAIMEKDAPHAIDAECLEALKMHHSGAGSRIAAPRVTEGIRLVNRTAAHA